MATLRPKRTVSRVVSSRARSPEGGAETGAAHVLDVPFAMRAVATAAGARWDAERSVFVWRGADLPASLVPFRPGLYSWEPHVERELNDEPASESLGAGRRAPPRPHQTAAVSAIVRAARGRAARVPARR